MLFTFIIFAVFQRSSARDLAFEHRLRAILCLDIALMQAFVTQGVVMFVDVSVLYSPWPFVGLVPART
jgi:hypothetical protein